MAATPLVSVDEYLNTSYEQDLYLKLPLSGRPDLPFNSVEIFEQMKREIAEMEGNSSEQD